MAKRADWLIDTVCFDEEKACIVKVKAFENLGDGIGDSKEFTRAQVIGRIESDETFVTTYMKPGADEY